ncbi:MAG: DUF1127 domain-containing protein [Granulosicoccus sp.]
MLIHDSLYQSSSDVTSATADQTNSNSRHSMPMQIANRTFHGLWHGWQAAVAGACQTILASEVRRERNALLDLNDQQLRDIGIDRITAKREAQRSWLDLPTGRSR